MSIFNGWRKNGKLDSILQRHSWDKSWSRVWDAHWIGSLNLSFRQNSFLEAEGYRSLIDPQTFFKVRLQLILNNRYTATYFENRYGNVNSSSGNKVKDSFFTEFDRNYAAPLLESHMKLLLSKRTSFVGTKTLCSALKFI